MRIASFVGTVLVGCGLIGLAVVGFGGAQNIPRVQTFQSGGVRLPNPAAGGAMLGSGAILYIFGKKQSLIEG